MLNDMDYSLIHRTPDGTGQFLVTTPGSPDKGSWETEAELKNWILADALLPVDIVNDLTTADPTKVLSAEQGTVLKQLIDAVSGGITPKGDILSTNLPPADDTNKGWQYYCTDINKWATSDGTQWIMTSNSIIVQTPDATDTGHALSNAVVTQCCNEVKGKLDQHESRLENLEQKAGDYSIVQYRGTNAVPTGKAKYGLVKSFVGKSRAWNQIVQNGNFASDSGWTVSAGTGSSYSVNDNIFSFTKASGVTLAAIQVYRSDMVAVLSHKYLLSCDVKSSIELPKFVLSFCGNWSSANYITTTQTWKRFSKILTLSTIYNTYINLISYGGGEISEEVTMYLKNVVAYDLTLIFGAGNEPPTVEEALAQLPALGQHNAYDADSLVDTEVSGARSVGRNRLKPSEFKARLVELGGTASGDNVTIDPEDLTEQLIWKNNTGYDVLSFCFAGSGQANMQIVYTDGTTENLQSLTTDGRWKTSNSSKTVDCLKGVWITGLSTFNTLKCGIFTGSTSTWSDYDEHTLSLSETVTLRSDDELMLETGTIVRKMVRVDLSDYDWSYSNGYWYMASGTKKDSFTNIVKGFGGSYVPNWVSAKYEIVKGSEVVLGVKLYAIGQSSDNGIICHNGSNTTPPSGALVAELATPTIESIDPIIDNFLEVQGGGTIDTIQEQTPVIDNCLDVGYLTV